MIKKFNEGYLIGVYRYTLYPLNGSRTHASILFPAPTVIITDSQEGQMFRQHRRRRRRRHDRRCRRRRIAAIAPRWRLRRILNQFLLCFRCGSRGTFMIRSFSPFTRS